MNGPSALGLCRALRIAGLHVPVSASVEFHRGLFLFDRLRLIDLYWVGRAVLLPRVDQLDVFDRVFLSYFTGEVDLRIDSVDLERIVAVDLGAGPPDESDQLTGDDEVSPDDWLRFSAAEQLAAMDFAAMSEAERVEADRVIDCMASMAPMRRSASWAPSRRRSGPIDVRATLRLAGRHDGEVVRWQVSERRPRPRRVVILIDISGSMSSYSRSLLRFAHSVIRAGVTAEVFALGTQVSRVSRQLGERDPDRALEQASHAVADWAGGTRLGSGLAEFCDRWGQRGIARGAVVVVLSDGWDRGDPALLALQMQRLARLAHRIIWVNPLKASDGYEPLAVGMAAALPYCDSFMSGHSLHALEELAVALGDACQPMPTRRSRR